MKNRLLALALCLVMTLGLAAPSFAVQADAPGGLDGAEPDLWDILAPDAPGGLDSEEPSLPAPDEPAQLDEPEETLPEETPDLTQIGENAPAESCLYCGAAGDVHADFCPLYAPAESGDTDEPAPVQPAPVLPADVETPAVPLETVLSQTPAQAVRTLSIDQPGVLTEDQRFSAFARLNEALFAENDEKNGENDELVDNDGIVTTKNVAYNEKTGQYDVTIESYVTGQTVTTETAAPADIILVLDMSAEMAKDGYLEAMKDAANQFIEMASSTNGERRIALVTYQNSAGTVISGDGDADESALVKVTTGEGELALKNAVTALSTPTGDAFCQYGLARAVQIFQSYTKSAPRYVILLSAGVFGEYGKKLRGENSENAAQVAINVSTVLKTSPQGATPNVKWVENFYGGQAMDKTDTQDNLKKDQGLTISFDAGDYASDIITPGGGCDAVVYCVGLNMPVQQIDGQALRGAPYFEYSEGDPPTETTNTMAGYGNTAARINEAMYRICSDRPDSTHVTRGTINTKNQWEVAAFPNVTESAHYYEYNNWSEKWEDTPRPYTSWTFLGGSKYHDIDWGGTYPDWATRNMPGGHFLTGDTNTIQKRFETIFENIQSSNPEASVKLGTETILTDVVTKYFEVPTGTNAITAEVVGVYDNVRYADLSGNVKFIENSDGTTSVTVTGFDYAKNFVNEKEQTGKKLVLTFTIQPKADFLGGEKVPTNVLPDSGVFTGEDDLVENLPDPGTQDVPLKEITLSVPDKSIYLSQTLTEEALFDGAVVKLKDYPDQDPLPLTNQEADWRFDFVTLTVDADQPYTGEFTDCTDVPVTATLAAKGDARNASTAQGEPTVHVFRPTVNVETNDVWADYGVNIDLAQECVKQNATTWDHNCGENAEEPSGAAPEISISDYTFYLVGENGVYTPITDGRYLTTEDDVNCVIGMFTYTVGGKSYSTGLSSNVKYPAGNHFTIHINHFDLKVSKSWTGADCYKQSAIFTLATADKAAMTMQLTLSPEKPEVTVHGLVCGKNYTLTEDTEWAWRHTASSTGSVMPGKHDQISKTAPKIDPAEVSFTNTLNSNLWFDAADIVHNPFEKKKGA